MKKILDIAKRFRKEEDGLALTEYLILLGLLTAAVIAAVTLAGDNLAVAWNSWAQFLGSDSLLAPSIS